MKEEDTAMTTVAISNLSNEIIEIENAPERLNVSLPFFFNF
jgi:hypothetical protein